MKLNRGFTGITLLAVGCLVVFSVAGFLIARHGFVSDGSKTLYTAMCSDGSSIPLKVSVHSTFLDLTIGDSIGYGLFYDPVGKNEMPLYDDLYTASLARQQGVTPSAYVGWKFDDGKYSGPTNISDFLPLPAATSGTNIRVFELPSRTYTRNERPYEWTDPPYMNIFLDPNTFSHEDFESIADCLGANRDAMNAALAAVRTHVPFVDRRYYDALRLGGVVYGLPPFTDEAYKQINKALWSGSDNTTVSIPSIGFFTLFPGQQASGVISGRQIVITTGTSSLPSIRINGQVFDTIFNSSVSGPIMQNDPGVSWSPIGGLSIEGTSCGGEKCWTALQFGGTHADGSEQFDVWQCKGNGCVDQKSLF